MKAYKHPIQQRLLEHAEAVFAAQGYEGATVRDIAARAETNAALIYYHFNSKESLYKAIFEFRLEQLGATLAQAQLQPEWSATKKLGALITAYMNSIRQHFYFHRILNSEVFSFRHHYFKRVILDSVRENSSLFRAVLQEGIAKKEFYNIDQDLFLMNLFHLLHHVTGKSPLASEMLNLEEYTDAQLEARILHHVLDQLRPANTSIQSIPE